MKIRARYVRYRDLFRLRWSRQFKAWLAEQAARLEMTEEEVFDLLKGGMTAQQIEAQSAVPPIEPSGSFTFTAAYKADLQPAPGTGYINSLVYTEEEPLGTLTSGNPVGLADCLSVVVGENTALIMNIAVPEDMNFVSCTATISVNGGQGVEYNSSVISTVDDKPYFLFNADGSATPFADGDEVTITYEMTASP